MGSGVGFDRGSGSSCVVAVDVCRMNRRCIVRNVIFIEKKDYYCQTSRTQVKQHLRAV